jgi:uncharacterized protein (TIGR02246 family)
MFCHCRFVAICVLVVVSVPQPAWSQEKDATGAIRKSAEQFVAAFNSGKVDSVLGMIFDDGELIDENGTVYKGSKEIKGLLTAVLEKFKGVKLSLNIESIRLAGPVAIEEGTRTMTADGAEKSRFRYLAVWGKDGNQWKLASFRDFSDDEPPTANEHLQAVAWLEGDWVNEGADGKVAISYRWSEDKNFLIGEFQVKTADGPRKSSQRIGWDPAAGRIRSWLFDADGGFGEGAWTVGADGVVIKSSSVNPDGSTASATMKIVLKDKDHFTISGTDRVVGDGLEDDFEITVSRRPPAPRK